MWSWRCPWPERTQRQPMPPQPVHEPRSLGAVAGPAIDKSFVCPARCFTIRVAFICDRMTWANFSATLFFQVLSVTSRPQNYSCIDTIRAADTSPCPNCDKDSHGLMAPPGAWRLIRLRMSIRTALLRLIGQHAPSLALFSSAQRSFQWLVLPVLGTMRSFQAAAAETHLH